MSLPDKAVPALLLAILAGCTESPAEPSAPSASASRIEASADAREGTLLDAASEFSTFLAAVEAAGMDAELTARGQRTLFAPTDEAFASRNLDADNIDDLLTADALRDLVLHHFTNGRRPSVSLGPSGQVRMADGGFVAVTRNDDGTFIGHARVVQPDLGAANGVIHGLDAVLAPEGVTLPPVQVDPPFWGTIFINPDIMTADDPTAFTALEPAGTDGRWMFDRRVNSWVWAQPLLFNASYADGLAIEVQVNPEFDAASALVEAEKYAAEIGRLPTALRADVETVWIHAGVQAFGGGNNNILIHTGQSALYERDGILHETLLHEAVHTSLDAAHRASAGWQAAQAADGNFISAYARDYPGSEDLAESFVPWFAARYAADRIPQALFDTIMATIPNRIAYLDAQNLDMYPVE